MKYFLAILIIVFICSCSSSSKLSDDFSCENTNSYTDLQKNSDFRKMFNIEFPKQWKVNLYYDDTKTSVYAADTTLSLTKTLLIDVTLVHSTVFIDKTFAQKITADNKKMKLTELKTKHTELFKKPSYYSYAEGKKANYPYHILNIFTKVNSDNFLHIKTEIYGDSLVEQRICNAIALIKKIQLN